MMRLVLALIGCCSITALAQRDGAQSSPVEANVPGARVYAAPGSQGNGQIPPQQELENLVSSSALIVWGHVSQTESYWQSDERGRHIYTTVTIQPVAWSIGEPVEETLVLEVVGGTVDGITESVSNVPAFREGEELFLFLTGSPYRLVGGRRGKLNVYEGKIYWDGNELPAEAFLEALELITAGLSPESVWERQKQRREMAPLALVGQTVITSITPVKASAGTDTQMTIIGSNFGAAQGTGKVQFFYKQGKPKISAEVLSWTNTRIVCTVPIGEVDGYPASAGSGPVTVKTSSSTSNERRFRVTFGYGGYKWADTDLPVKYYINENTSDSTGEGNAIRRAASTWENAAGGRFSFEDGGSHTHTVSDLDNGMNELMWGSIPDAPTALAVTYYKHNAMNILLECDIVFNSSYNWSTASTTPSNRYDVESVALHELGHWLNLRDLYGDVGDSEYDVDKMMYGEIRSGVKKRALHDDDKAGIRWIYSEYVPEYVDIGLRVYDGTAIVSIACEPAGTLTSPLRIAKNGVIYGIVLVDPSDQHASRIRVKTNSGVKALRKY